MSIDKDSNEELTRVLREGIMHHQAGRLAEAEQCYRSVLALAPANPDANHNLGILAGQVGQFEVSLRFLKTALEANPAQRLYWLSYAEALLKAGQAGDARKILDQAIGYGLNGADVDDLRQRIAAADSGGAQKRIIQCFQEGRLEEVEQQARELLALNPDDGFAWKCLGAALKAMGRSADALAATRRAAELLPGDPLAQCNLGDILNDHGLFAEAAERCRKALQLKPDFAGALHNLGISLQGVGQREEARDAYQRAVQLDPSAWRSLNNLGLLNRDMKNPGEAATNFRQALVANPGAAEIHVNLGNVLQQMGDAEGAVAAFTQAYRLCPDRLEYLIAANLILPVIAPSSEAMGVWRARYRAGVEAIASQAGGVDDPVGALGRSLTFDLAYHQASNRQLRQDVCRMLRQKCPALSFVSPALAAWVPPDGGRRIRVGFISQFLVGHTIGKLFQGLIRELDRQRFEVTVVHVPGAKLDAISDEIARSVDHVIVLEGGLVEQQRVLAEAGFDVLFYPDIGMSPATDFLAYARVAPVQAVGWGHPETTGIDTVDYFISSELIEPEGAAEEYSETLIQLPRLPCFYEPFLAPENLLSRQELGLPEEGALYGCPQSLFKIHPDFDSVLAEIASADPSGHIVFLESEVGEWRELLRERWRRSYPDLVDRVLFLPRQRLGRFMMLMAHFDVLLDPVYFGSGNTLYEAMVYGTPIVTMPGEFMRGRVVSGAYRQMGIEDPELVVSRGSYARAAVALGQDPFRRRQLREQLRLAAGQLFKDHLAVAEFGEFLEAAVAAAATGSKLPPTWRAGRGR